MGLGIWYPSGGFESVVKAFVEVGSEQGITYKTSSPVNSIAKTPDGFVVSTEDGKNLASDIVIANAEYQFVDQQLLAPENQSYSASYWKSRKLAPSGVIINLGLTKKLKNIAHHTLFFNTDWDKHFADIENKKSNTTPLFYIAAPSKSDVSVAPKSHENLFVLVPQAAGADISESDVQKIRNFTVSKISQQVGTDIEDLIDYEKIFTNQYFVDYFNADQGNAFGLSHTTLQSSIRRPPIRHKKLAGLYFTGQFTNPGTGAPLVTISGEVVRRAIAKDYS
jgi:phytoene desaturase